MEFKGTKGKWQVLKIDLADYKSISIGNPINNKVICHMTLGGSINNTDEANALLISKATEMLDELKFAVKALKVINSFGATKLVIDRLEKLIKEATEL